MLSGYIYIIMLVYTTLSQWTITLRPNSFAILMKCNPYPADHDYCRFKSVLLADKITVVGNEMTVETSRFANIWSQIKQI